LTVEITDYIDKRINLAFYGYDNRHSPNVEDVQRQNHTTQNASVHDISAYCHPSHNKRDHPVFKGEMMQIITFIPYLRWDISHIQVTAAELSKTDYWFQTE